MSRCAEEAGEAAEDAVDVHVPLGLHQLADHAQQVDHDLVLPVAQGVVLEEVEADGEAVLEVVDAEDLVDGLVEDGGEGGQIGGEQLLVRAPTRPGAISSAIASGARSAKRSATACGSVSSASSDVGPLGDGQPLGQQAVAEQQQRAVEAGERRLQRRPLGRLPHQVVQQGVALQEGERLRSGSSRQRVSATVRSGSS